MKKNYIFYACAAAALVFASCQKESTALEGIQQVPADMDIITATAVSTKTTTQDGVNVLWENGDKISLFSLVPTSDPAKPTADFATYTTTLNSPSASASFVKDETSTNIPTAFNEKYVAFYTKGASLVTKSRNGNAAYLINKEQVAKNGGDFASSIMYATSAGSDFQFSHMVSYIKFTVDQGSTPFNKLTVSSVDDAQYVVTRIQVDFVSDPVVTLLPVNPSNGNVYSQSNKTVSITTDDAANFAPGTYYMAINADTYAQGLKLTFSNGTSDYTITTPSNVVMNAGAVANLGTIGKLEFPQAPETPETASKLGTVYAEGGVNLGVVFCVDATDPSKGKIISGPVTNVAWGPAKDLSDDMDNYITSHSVVENHEYVKNASDYSETNYPAVYFCDNLPGGNWRLPSHDEQMQLFKTYWGLESLTDGTNYNTDANSASMNKFDSALAQCVADDQGTTYDETKLNLGLESSEKSVMYWSGEARSESLPSSRVFRVVFAPKFTFASYGNPASVHYVRCVREVELQ